MLSKPGEDTDTEAFFDYFGFDIFPDYVMKRLLRARIFLSFEVWTPNESLRTQEAIPDHCLSAPDRFYHGENKRTSFTNKDRGVVMCNEYHDPCPLNLKIFSTVD